MTSVCDDVEQPVRLERWFSANKSVDTTQRCEERLLDQSVCDGEEDYDVAAANLINSYTGMASGRRHRKPATRIHNEHTQPTQSGWCWRSHVLLVSLKFSQSPHNSMLKNLSGFSPLPQFACIIGKQLHSRNWPPTGPVFQGVFESKELHCFSLCLQQLHLCL